MKPSLRVMCELMRECCLGPVCYIELNLACIGLSCRMMRPRDVVGLLMVRSRVWCLNEWMMYEMSGRKFKPKFNFLKIGIRLKFTKAKFLMGVMNTNHIRSKLHPKKENPFKTDPVRLELVP